MNSQSDWDQREQQRAIFGQFSALRQPTQMPMVYDPGEDPIFVHLETLTLFQLGVTGSPVWFDRCWFVRLLWHRTPYFRMAWKCFITGRRARKLRRRHPPEGK